MSVAASADGRRSSRPWPTHAQPLDAPSPTASSTTRGLSSFRLPTVRAAAPAIRARLPPLPLRAGRADGLWKLKDGVETELWKGSDGVVAAAPAISTDGTQVALRCEPARNASLPDGLRRHRRATFGGSGRSRCAVLVSGRRVDRYHRKRGRLQAALQGSRERGAAVRMAEGILSNPVWSPDGRFILYSEGQRGGAVSKLRAVTPDGKPFPLPDLPEVGVLGNRIGSCPMAST